MNRLIKFRCWKRYDKKMFEPKSIPNGWESDLGEAGATVLMQYTGLKDNNGKEIYEGDVVSFGKGQSLDVIEWNNEYGGWEPWVVNIEGFDTFNSYPCTVLGNIYENPELLNAKTL